MSHTHADRIADRPRHLCAAYGCPLTGTSSTSTSGSDEWWCFAHFGLDYGQVQAATTEVNRVPWLAAAAQDVRDVNRVKPGTPESKAAFALIEHELTLHGRKDLLLIQGESRRQWLNRLEGALLAIVRESVKPPPVQLTVATENVNTFGRVGFDMPA
jgi:hypothetical protein